MGDYVLGFVMGGLGGWFATFMWFRGRVLGRRRAMRAAERAYLDARRAGGYPSPPGPPKGLPRVESGPAPGAPVYVCPICGAGTVVHDCPGIPPRRPTPPPPPIEGCGPRMSR